MKSGDTVYHRTTGQRLVILGDAGGGNVAVIGRAKNYEGKVCEMQTAVDWKDLRLPTAEELAGSPPAVPAPQQQEVEHGAKAPTDPASDVDPEQKHNRRKPKKAKEEATP